MHNPLSSGISKASDPEINLWTLRRLANKPMLQIACAQTLAVKINLGAIARAELFRFPIAVVCEAIRRAEPDELANLFITEKLGKLLLLAGSGLGIFLPLDAAVVKPLFVYYALPEGKRPLYLHYLNSTNADLYAETCLTLETNRLARQGDEFVIRDLATIGRKFKLVGLTP